MPGMSNLNNTTRKCIFGGLMCGAGAFVGGLIGGPIGIGVGSAIGAGISARLLGIHLTSITKYTRDPTTQ